MSGNSGYIDAFYKTPHPVRSHNSTGILFDQDRHMDNLATSLGIQARVSRRISLLSTTTQSSWAYATSSLCLQHPT